MCTRNRSFEHHAAADDSRTEPVHTTPTLPRSGMDTLPATDRRLLERFGLNSGQICLLELLPLVRMVWADGRNQAEEVVLIKDFIDVHVAWLRTAGLAIAAGDVDEFKRRFVDNRPDERMMRRLSGLLDSGRFADLCPARSPEQREKIVADCLEIAAAASVPIGGRETRCTPEERDILYGLIQKIYPPPPRRAYFAGDQIGDYQIVRPLGKGGMGWVYLVEREEDNRQFALKVLRPERVDDDIIRRFHREREILGLLEHPNIARLVDGGNTDDGLPYLVMDYVVGGRAITAYCIRHKLGIKARIRLFMRVCDTVDYAHHKLIVHRDIKPGNILVGGDGEPKLLDFGIAKLLDTGLGDHATTQRLLTPEYASPEQVEGRPITVATDVYALGLLLHELLTGRKARHWSGAAPSLTEKLSALREYEPVAPSVAVLQHGAPHKARRLSRMLRGDLDRIVIKALKRDVRLRYPSARLLAQDLEDYLAGKPISAREPEALHLLDRVLYRHRYMLLATTCVSILALAAVGWNAQRLNDRLEPYLDVIAGDLESSPVSGGVARAIAEAYRLLGREEKAAHWDGSAISTKKAE